MLTLIEQTCKKLTNTKMQLLEAFGKTILELKECYWW